MTEVKYIVRTVVGKRDIKPLIEAIPGLIVVEDKTQNSMDTFIAGLNAAGDSPAVHLEDDIILCRDFFNRANRIINTYPDQVIQFFSMRKDDLTIGTRFIPGTKFMMNQCFYLPTGMSAELAEYRKTWKRIGEHPTGYDIMMSDYFRERKISYLNIVPNLVDHIECKSLINPKRSSKRQSLTFKY